ncbi:glycosyltransferase involved in cell wall biosynthesis [Povalibacter uvarum]|uniref:Glycosyltransferase involved in cell wall biosynthesis n=1 Tax=Povalibacter uvarum TaxID=732238 RepID=A0A841HFX8_9GAMM|nr:glycosyltransferase family A protein [Povalibacter uvarum]MBB6091260.1 glycosyltransferase involved in cell wall biosynthesis [Povalibacter uvarum]
MSVSIVIPTFARPALLRRLLDSILLQTHPAYEVIVVDDCSPQTDEYENLRKEYSGRFAQFSFLRNPGNRGAPFSRNRGIREARYELVALVDDDDEWLPQKLERQLRIFGQEPERVGLVYTWTDVVERGERTPFYRSSIEGACLRQLVSECFIPSPSVMLRKNALLDAGLFDEQMPSCQDWDMWTRVVDRGYEVRVAREALTLYHKQEGASIGTSPRARTGYVMYYRKHLWKLVRLRQWRHLVRFARMAVQG